MAEAPVYTTSPGVAHTLENGVDTLSWSNRDIPKDALLTGGSVLGTLVFGILAIFLTTQFLADLFRWGSAYSISASEIAISVFFLLAFWTVTIFLGSHLLQITWTETIRVDENGFSLEYEGLFSPKWKVIPERNLWRLSFERYGLEHHKESRFTLNIFHDDQRESLAYWMRRRDLLQLFQLLSTIIEERDWTVDLKAEKLPS